MKILLAKNSLTDEAKEIDFSALVELLKTNGVAFLDYSSDKSVFNKLQKEFARVIAAEVKFGLAEGESIYEVHIVE